MRHLERMHRFLFALAIAALSAARPAASAEDAGPIVRLDVLDGGMTARGTYQAALRFTLADGWKTYWRSPGEAGIPPVFTWRRSDNVADVAITWPTPVTFELYGLRSIGYKNELVLPIEITPETPDRPVRLSGDIELGVCNEVCVPSALNFDHALDAGAGPNPLIAAALARRPLTAREAGVRSAACRLRPTPDGMRIEARIAMPNKGSGEFTVIEPGNPELWATEAQVSRRGGTLVASSELINNGGGAFAIDRSRIRITVLGRDRAVDIRGCAAG